MMMTLTQFITRFVLLGVILIIFGCATTPTILPPSCTTPPDAPIVLQNVYTTEGEYRKNIADLRLIRIENTPLKTGDVVITRPKEVKTICFRGGTEVILKPNTKVKIQSVFEYFGEVIVKVRDYLTHFRKKFQVETKYVVAGTEGTEFQVTGDSQNQVDVILSEGRVNLISKDQKWPIAPLMVNKKARMRQQQPPQIEAATQEEIQSIKQWRTETQQAEERGVIGIPSVVGLSEAVAKRILSENRFVNVRTSTRPGPESAGIVLEQRPSEGTEVPPNNPVILIVSSGPTSAMPPNQMTQSTNTGLTLSGHRGSVYHASFSPNGQRMITTSSDGTARLWDNTGQQLVEFKGHTGDIYRAAFSPNGQRIVTASKDGTARLWNANTGKLINTLTGHRGEVFHADFSPNGRLIVTTAGDLGDKDYNNDKTARLWNSNGQLITQLSGHQKDVIYATFSPDSQQVITTSWDTTARLWNVRGQQLAVFSGHKDAVHHAAFSPNGLRVVTAAADNDKTARLWNANTKKLITVLSGHQARVWRVAFSPDGQRIVTASKDKTARLWNANGQLVANTQRTSKWCQ
ncbi:WD-40 repeat protein [Beggiatoa sp. PS]|nr:WD-40 repeat protein [Beggiatoa sp. PS]